MPQLLIIEDDASLCRFLKSMFELSDYEVFTADDGTPGIDLFKQRGADVVITDIILPDREGIQTIRELKRIDNAVKIIAISGGGMIGAKEYLHLAKKAGAQYTFEKPFHNDELIAAVKQLTEQGESCSPKATT